MGRETVKVMEEVVEELVLKIEVKDAPQQHPDYLSTEETVRS